MRFYWLICRKQKLVQSKTLQQSLYVLILEFRQCRRVFVHYLMSILMICKKTRGYIYQVASREFSFAATYFKKEWTRKISFLQEQITEYTVLEIQFRSVNYRLVATICKNFKQNKPCSRQKQYIIGFKVNKTFWISFPTAKHLPVILRLFIKNGSDWWRASCILVVNFKQL